MKKYPHAAVQLVVVGIIACLLLVVLLSAAWEDAWLENGPLIFPSAVPTTVPTVTLAPSRPLE